ncbi:hypothetical protein [Aureimonas ureilytica]|uniref:hypothetical protein n=1 Tax=Aureimonas ureilytica TaxID=401562 RepID=UPI000AF88EC6|nr:hypothetical protein [Aureimonas ureilytica]
MSDTTRDFNGTPLSDGDSNCLRDAGPSIRSIITSFAGAIEQTVSIAQALRLYQPA